MPKDTDDRLVPHSRRNLKKTSDLHRLTRYVKDKATKEANDSIVNYPEIEKACLFLLSKIIITEENEPNNIPKTAFANFLDVLSHAESFRLKIIEQADLALNTWHIYFTSADPAQALSSGETRKLEAIIKSKDEWRTVYMKILKKTVALDLYYLFISKPWFASDFMVRLFEYNPHMFKSTNDLEPCPRKFVYLLSEDEMKQVKDTTKKSLQLVKDSYEWLEENFANDTMAGLYSEEFQETHPPPTDLQRLQNLLYYYLKHISGIYEIFNRMFPP